MKLARDRKLDESRFNIHASGLMPVIPITYHPTINLICTRVGFKKDQPQDIGLWAGVGGLGDAD